MPILLYYDIIRHSKRENCGSVNFFMLQSAYLSAAPSTIDIVHSNMTYILCDVASSNRHPQHLRLRRGKVYQFATTDET